MKIDHRGKMASILIEDGVGERVSLPIGDLEWEARGVRHIVEIKTAEDFAKSMQKGHLQDQVARMQKEENCQLHLLIVGEYYEQWLGGKPTGDTVVEDVFSTVHATTSVYSAVSRTSREKRVGVQKYIKFPYAALVNYITHLEEDGWRVHHISRLRDYPHAVRLIEKRTHKPRREFTEQAIRTSSLDPRANALRAIPGYQHLSRKGAQSLVRAYWRDPINLNGVVFKDLVALEGIGQKSAEKIINER